MSRINRKSKKNRANKINKMVKVDKMKKLNEAYELGKKLRGEKKEPKSFCLGKKCPYLQSCIDSDFNMRNETDMFDYDNGVAECEYDYINGLIYEKGYTTKAAKDQLNEIRKLGENMR